MEVDVKGSLLLCFIWDAKFTVIPLLESAGVLDKLIWHSIALIQFYCNFVFIIIH